MKTHHYKINIPFSFFIFIPTILLSQIPTWEREYGIQNRADFSMGRVVETNGGDFVICGSTLPMYFPLWNIDGYIVKVNAYGDTIWSKRVGDSLGGYPKDYLWDVIINNNNELVFAGTRFVPYVGVGAQVWFLKITMDGSIITDKRIGGSEEDNANEIIQNPDGTYMVLGDTKSFGTQIGGKDVWLLKLNSNGDTIWTRTYDFGYEDMGTGIIPFQNNNYLVTTFSKTGSIGTSDCGFASYLVINANGDTLKVRRFREDSLTSFAYIKPTNEGGAIIAGQRSAMDNFPNRDIWILKLDSNADTLWTKTYGAYGKFDGGLCIFQSNNGGYYLSAYTQSFTPPGMEYDNWWLLRLNDTGDTLWTRLWGGPLNDDPYTIIPTSDGGLLIAGWKDANSWDSLTLGDAQFWVMKTDSLGLVQGIEDSNISSNLQNIKLSISPNPFNGKTSIDFEISEPGYVRLKIFDVSGREIETVLKRKLEKGRYSVLYIADCLPNGVYFCELRNNNKLVQRKKMVLLDILKNLN